jgi:hypothetical protein
VPVSQVSRSSLVRIAGIRCFTYTGSMIPGVAPIGKASCSGSCGGFYSAYDGGPNSGYFVQLPGAGSETHTVTNPEGSASPLTALTDLQAPAAPGSQAAGDTDTLSEWTIAAPAYHWIFVDSSVACSDCAFNFAALGRQLAGMRLWRRYVNRRFRFVRESKRSHIGKPLYAASPRNFV